MTQSPESRNEKRWFDDRTIVTIYAAVLLLGTAYGVTTGIISLFFSSRGIGDAEVGRLASLFALGIGLASLPAGAWVRKRGGKEVLLTALATFSLCLLALPWLNGFALLAGTRVLDGASSAAAWVACETLLLARAPRSQKARVMSVYAVCFAIGYVLGPALALVVVPAFGHSGAFRAAAVLTALAAVIVLLRIPGRIHAGTASDDEDIGPPSGMLSTEVARRVKVSMFATFSYGYFQSSLVVFLPLELVRHHHIAADDTIFVVAAFALGMLVFAPIVARIGDRVGQLVTMRVLAVIGTFMVGSFIFLDSLVAMCGACFVAGATLATLSPLSLALQGQVVSRGDLPRANGFYNAAYAAGMLLGPAISGMLFATGERGGVAMLAHLAVLWMTFVVLTVVFAKDDPRHAQFVSVRDVGVGPA